MDRRHLLVSTSSVISSAVVGYLGNDTDDTDLTTDDTDSHTVVHDQLTLLDHHLGEKTPFYTYGHVNHAGTRAVMASFPTPDSPVGSTLLDVSAPTEIEELHQVEASTTNTWTNDVKFDPLRDGVYYRSQEREERGIEVIDFGWNDGSSTDPIVIARLDISPVGVHKMTAHPTEPLLYLVDVDEDTETGVHTVDVSDPSNPEIIHSIGPPGGCHDVEYDATRELLHAAYIHPPSEGYVIYDASDPYALTIAGQFAYADEPDYTAIGEPGFERCHQADPDEQRDIVVLADEVATGVPGGKHIMDIGWDTGSIESPEPIGFTHAPDAEEMAEEEQFWWTTHFHDIITMGSETLLVDGGYRQGVWVCNLTDPRDPFPTDAFATVEAENRAPDHGEDYPAPSSPPFAWGALYNEAQNFVFATDSLTGAYTFELTSENAE